ncbi:hypothetical protein M0R45_030942 [Rubus argutus]|uniref:Uncharacterized protein n=1 Tax=Rubus argutus TaxID=59490 RepID=A0AAW1WEL7_RUBAR
MGKGAERITDRCGWAEGLTVSATVRELWIRARAWQRTRGSELEWRMAATSWSGLGEINGRAATIARGASTLARVLGREELYDGEGQIAAGQWLG